MSIQSTVSRAGGPALDTAPPGIRPSVWAHMPWPARRAWIERHGLEQTRQRLSIERRPYPLADSEIREMAERILAELPEEDATVIDQRILVLDPMRNRADIGSVLTDAEKAAGWTPELIRAAERKAAHGSRDKHAVEGRQLYRRCIGRIRKARVPA